MNSTSRRFLRHREILRFNLSRINLDVKELFDLYRLEHRNSISDFTFSGFLEGVQVEIVIILQRIHTHL